MLVMDCTASMAQWRELLLEALPVVLCQQLPAHVPLIALRVGFVGYRDCTDIPRWLTQPLYPVQPASPASLQPLLRWISALPLEGGEDEPEDVIGGLHMAGLMLNDHRDHGAGTGIPAATNCVLLVGHSPAHGDGMPELKDSREQLAAMAADAFTFTADSVLQALSAQQTELAVLRLNSLSDRMLTRFQRSFDQFAPHHHMAVLDVSSLAADQRLGKTVSKLSAFLINSWHKTLLRTPLQLYDAPAAEEAEEAEDQKQEMPPIDWSSV